MGRRVEVAQTAPRADPSGARGRPWRQGRWQRQRGNGSRSPIPCGGPPD